MGCDQHIQKEEELDCMSEIIPNYDAWSVGMSSIRRDSCLPAKPC